MGPNRPNSGEGLKLEPTGRVRGSGVCIMQSVGLGVCNVQSAGVRSDCREPSHLILPRLLPKANKKSPLLQAMGQHTKLAVVSCGCGKTVLTVGEA